MKKRYIIIKKYTGGNVNVRYNDRMYLAIDVNNENYFYTDNISAAIWFLSEDAAEARLSLLSGEEHEGIFQVEKIYYK